MLYGGSSADNVWTSLGFSGWDAGHGLRAIERHEASMQHRQGEIIKFQWLHNSRIDRILVTQKQILVEQNRKVMYIAVKAVKFLATEMMAMHGHTSSDRKFLHLFTEFAEFDASATGYLQELNEIRNRDIRNKPEVNFISPLNCKRLVLTIKNIVVQTICSEVCKQQAFSVINDGTQDLPKKDAQVIIVRYIETKDGVTRPVERLTEVFTTGDSSGEALCNKLLSTFAVLNLDLQWIVGRSYDGAGNVRGKYSGFT